MAALGCPEEIPRAADLEIAHRDPESGAELGVLADRLHAAASLAHHHHVAREHQVGVGLLATASDPSAELVKIGQTEAVGAVDDDRVGVGDIEPALDDRGRDQHVGIALHEALHHGLQLPLLHLAVPHQRAHAGAEFPEPGSHLFDRADPVVEQVDLPSPGPLPLDRVADDALVVGADHGLDGLAVGRRRLDHRHVARPHEREVEGAGNRRGGEGQHVDQPEAVLERLLVLHPEPLFLVDDDEPDVLEGHVGREKPVRPHHQVDRSVGQSLHHFPLLGGGAVTAQQLDLDGILAHPLTERPRMLLGQHRGGCEKDNLLPAHERLEGGPQRHLGLAEPDIAAEKAIHRPARLHVLLDLGDRAQLVRGLPVGKALLQLVLPRRVGPVGVTLTGLPLRLQTEKAAGVKEDRFLGGLAGLRPLVVAEGGEIGGVLSDADIAGNLPRLIDRDKEPRIIRELQRQNLPLAPVRRGELLESQVAADPVLRMDHQIAFREFREVDGGARCPLAFAPQVKPPETLAGGAAEEFRIGKDRELRRRKAEAARDRADPGFGEIGPGLGFFGGSGCRGSSGSSGMLGRRFHGGEGEFPEPLSLPLGGAEQDDPPPAPPPVGKLPEELAAASLVDDEIPGPEGGEGNRIETEYLGIPLPGFPGLLPRSLQHRGGRDQEPMGRGLRGRTIRCGLSLPDSLLRFGFPADFDHEVVLLEVSGKGNARLVGVAQLHLAPLELPDGGLRIGIELTDRTDPLLVELQTARHRLLPGEEVEDAAAQGEFAASRHLGHPLVAGVGKPDGHASRSTLPSGGERQQITREVSGRGDILLPLGRGDHRRHGLAARNPAEQGQTLGGRLRVGQAEARRGDLKIGEEKRLPDPRRKFRGELLLRPDITADEPDAPPVAEMTRRERPKEGPRLLGGIPQKDRR